MTSIRLRFYANSAYEAPPTTIGGSPVSYQLVMVDNRGVTGAPANGTVWEITPTSSTTTPCFTLTLPKVSLLAGQNLATYANSRGYAMELRVSTVGMTAPTFSPAGGSFVRATDVAVNADTSADFITYSTDGTDPTDPQVNRLTPGQTVAVDRSLTLSARAWQETAPGVYTSSDRVQAAYTITGDMSIGSIKKAQTDSLVGCDTAYVTAAFPDRLYIESEDRMQGILVEKQGHGMQEGMRASVIGYVTTNENGERCIDADTVSQVGTELLTIPPLGLAHRSIGGSSFLDATAQFGQHGIPGALGVNNIGLLIRTWGVVTAVHSGFFYIDDGSGVSDGFGSKGVKVYGTVPVGGGETALGKFVAVTGISSCEKPEGDLIRVILTRSPEDIQVIR